MAYFAYKDELARLPGMPPLIHTWTIDEIQVDHSGADEWRTVDRTRHDDPGGYRLRCTLEDVPPTRTAS